MYAFILYYNEKKRFGCIKGWDGTVTSTHHVSLSAVLSRGDEDVVPGQQEQQSQRDHAELKVPHHHYEELSRWAER